MKEPEAKITNTNQRHVLICGGRTQLNYDDFEKCVLEVLTENNLSDIEIVSGCCKGVDLLGEEFAHKHNHPVAQFPAEWNKYGRGAGIVRNKQMLEYIASFEKSIVIAFWNGTSKGTGYTVNQAKKMGIQVFIYHYDENGTITGRI